MSKLAKDAVNKKLIISKVYLEKILKFFLCHWIFGFRATFLLVSLLDHYFMKKRGGKKDLIWPIDPGGFEMVLILLAETIAIKV